MSFIHIYLNRLATSWISTLSLHALFRSRLRLRIGDVDRVLLVDIDPARTTELLPLRDERAVLVEDLNPVVVAIADEEAAARVQDRKSTRLNSSHRTISYAVFCLKK